MRQLLLFVLGVIVIILLIVGIVALTMQTSSQASNFTASLSGSQEVPANSSTGSGSGTFTLSGNSLKYFVSVSGLSSQLTAAHFHAGNPGISGPPIRTITFVALPDGTYASQGVWVMTDDEVKLLEAQGIYVNVHTTNYPNGEVRGQLFIA